VRAAPHGRLTEILVNRDIPTFAQLVSLQKE